MMALALVSCEEMEDYQQTIDAAPALAYVNPKAGDTFSTLIVHRPTGSTGSFHTEFQPNCNTTNHEAVTVNVEYDADLVDSYNEKNGTSYAVLPKDYVKLTNPSVIIAADTTASRDTVMIDLDAEKDLSALTERAYLAPFKIVSDGIQTSTEKGNLWFVVNTEVNLIRPITSADEMVGFPAGGTSEWTADCGDAANLFDGDDNTEVAFESENVVTVDMKKSVMVTGLRLNTYSISSLSIEYSEDAVNWKQAGTPASGEYVYGDGSWQADDYYVALYDYVQARYLRLTFSMDGYYTYVNDLYVYMIESTDPTIYAITGSDNVVSGKVVHVKGSGSQSDFSTSFKAYTTVTSDKGYKVTAAVDNSLVDAYNAKHNTSYAAMPSENVDLQNASLTIEADQNASSESVTVSLKGDLTGLTNENGYLIPVKLSASGAVSSESRGVVYAVIKSEYKLIKPINSAEDIVGFPAGGRSSWTADCDNSANLFDGSNSTGVRFAQQNGNTLTVNFGGKRLVTGLHFYSYGISDVSVEYSPDGSEWKTAGTADDSDVVNTGSQWGTGDYYMAFGEALEAQSIRVSFSFTGYYYRRVYELDVYEIESTDPTVYAVCGTDNVFTGKIVHHNVAGSKASVEAAFNAMCTDNSGYSVKAAVDASLVDAYNSSHNTKYAPLDASYVQITGSPCEIASGSNKSQGQISVTLKGDLSSLTNTDGYLVPVKLSADGAVTSSGRGVVYVAFAVETSTAVFKDNFSISDIEGSQVSDRSGWSILEYDDSIHSGTYNDLLDGSTTTYVRTWGGPISFTVDLGKEYEMTGIVITARTDISYYSTFQPKTMLISSSLDGKTYTELGTAATSDATLVSSTPSSYVSFYAAQKVRYLKIEASYGSNMGTSEFNIYAK